MALDATRWEKHPSLNLMVSSDGRVIGPSGAELSPSTIATGYKRIRVAKMENGRAGHKLLHRLVAETFIKNPGGLQCINHKDGNKGNNRIDNLEWCDYGHNNRHALSTGLRVMVGRKGAAAGDRNGRSKLTKVDVEKIRSLVRGVDYRNGDSPWIWFGISSAQFSAIRTGKAWKEINHGA
jgi:hypothetical protein